MSLRLLVFLGSTREGRMGENVAKCVVNMLREKEHQVDLVGECQKEFGMLIGRYFSVVIFNCSIYGDDHHIPSTVVSELIQTIDKTIITSDDFFLGSFGGIRAAAAARPFLSELGMISTPSVCIIPQVMGKFDTEGICSDERIQKNLEKVVAEIQWYANAIEEKKQASGVPS
ncbi:uncharacterized protein LOC122250657 [Penaeus japonicus]|uniref:uncharacterized protein LOC122250657 n=1 Tax=Penaeus japonicus TaxID=27405 RepID=UPI001C71254E|nr:uncharacterized protein LOC122250657 [Penaeus japonicus]